MELSMAEYVLAIPRTELEKQNIGTAVDVGLYPIDLNKLDPRGFAFFPRHIINNKSDASVAAGKLYPQVIGYYQIESPNGQILTYRRKGKEKGLLGKYSIGVGGHIDICDFEEDSNLIDIINAASGRELYEEIGLDIDVSKVKHNQVLSTWIDKTSQVHVGLPAVIKLTQNMFYAIVLEDSEFLEAQWLTREELKQLSTTETFEPWSQILINNF